MEKILKYSCFITLVIDNLNFFKFKDVKFKLATHGRFAFASCKPKFFLHLVAIVPSRAEAACKWRHANKGGQRAKAERTHTSFNTTVFVLCLAERARPLPTGRPNKAVPQVHKHIRSISTCSQDASPCFPPRNPPTMHFVLFSDDRGEIASGQGEAASSVGMLLISPALLWHHRRQNASKRNVLKAF